MPIAFQWKCKKVCFIFNAEDALTFSWNMQTWKHPGRLKQNSQQHDKKKKNNNNNKRESNLPSKH